MIIQRRIKFILHKRHTDDTKAKIRMRITLHGKTPLDFPMGLGIKLSQWDSIRQCAMPTATNASCINRTIDE